VCERTVPIKYLNDKGKDKTGDVEDLYNLIPDSPKAPEKRKMIQRKWMETTLSARIL
jgi:hypothetical protein